MRRPITKRTTPRVRDIEIESATKMITLEDPEEDLTHVRDAFVRLRPPEGMLPDRIDSWRNVVAKHAKAVKVLAPPKGAHVPADSARVDEGDKVGTFREEALALAKESSNKEVVKLVTSILDNVGA